MTFEIPFVPVAIWAVRLVGLVNQTMFAINAATRAPVLLMPVVIGPDETVRMFGSLSPISVPQLNRLVVVDKVSCGS